jgi:hypothetical protein
MIWHNPHAENQSKGAADAAEGALEAVRGTTPTLISLRSKDG